MVRKCDFVILSRILILLVLPITSFLNRLRDAQSSLVHPYQRGNPLKNSDSTIPSVKLVAQIKKQSFGVVDVDDMDEDEEEEVLPNPAILDLSLTKAKKPRSTPLKIKVKQTPREATGYTFHDEEGEYDVPILNTSMWFKLQVVKGEEITVRDRFLNIIGQNNRSTSSTWRGRVTDVHVPEEPHPKFKGIDLVPVMKPSKPGVVYIKAKMDPDIADDMESLPGVVRLVRDSETKLVLPLSMSQGSDLEAARSTQRTELNEELRQLKKDDYVTVVAGEYAGHYGLLKTMRSGRFEVLLRGEGVDTTNTIKCELGDLRYLPNPPEKKLKEMTARDALEAIMESRPDDPVVRSLRKMGKLDEILYSEEEQAAQQRRRDSRSLAGVGAGEGARRIRSIAKSDTSTFGDRRLPAQFGGGQWDDFDNFKDYGDRTAQPRSQSSKSTTRKEWTPNRSTTQSYERSKDHYPSEPGPKSTEKSGGSGSDDDDWFNSLLTRLADPAPGLREKSSKEKSRISATQASAGVIGGSDDYDSLIQSLLSDLDSDGESKNNANSINKANGNKFSTGNKDRAEAVEVETWLNDLDDDRDSDDDFDDLLGEKIDKLPSSVSRSMSTDLADSESVLDDLLRKLGQDSDTSSRESQNKFRGQQVKRSFGTTETSTSAAKSWSRQDNINSRVAGDNKTLQRNEQKQLQSLSEWGLNESDESPRELWSSPTPLADLTELLAGTDIVATEVLRSLDFPDGDSGDRPGAVLLSDDSGGNNISPAAQTGVVVSNKRAWVPKNNNANVIGNENGSNGNSVGRQNKNNSDGKKNSSRNSAVVSSVPNMEDFADFDEYLEALTKHDKQALDDKHVSSRISFSDSSTYFEDFGPKKYKKQSMNVDDLLEDLASPVGDFTRSGSHQWRSGDIDNNDDDNGIDLLEEFYPNTEPSKSPRSPSSYTAMEIPSLSSTESLTEIEPLTLPINTPVTTSSKATKADKGMSKLKSKTKNDSSTEVSLREKANLVEVSISENESKPQVLTRLPPESKPTTTSDKKSKAKAYTVAIQNEEAAAIAKVDVKSEPKVSSISSDSSVGMSAIKDPIGLTVKELKDRLRAEGKPTSGTKAELVARLGSGSVRE